MARAFDHYQSYDKKSMQVYFTDSLTDEDGVSIAGPLRSTVLQLTAAEKTAIDGMTDRAKAQLKAEIIASKPV